MEIREFAERVLFATTLEEKLHAPDVLTDAHPGPAIATPAAPGRPRALQFKPTGAARDAFPGTRRLERAQERGRLLHFFANHELLATELMALVLLKFPEAPPAFRRGVLRTLQDEQEHTRLYLERMHASGIAFGELPVSGYFWRAVSGMESPLDYVAGLCLTFEQANLDFARHFARSFATVGDEPTSRLLDRIYQDEIGHVAYGLKWLRRWKNPTESDWNAFCRALKFPLSPQRAKGFTLNIEGRRAAGLSSEFIEALNVFSQSKGRTPNVYVFNPFAEGRIAEGRAFNPTQPQRLLARDLENLPQFLCRQDDIVLVERKPSVHFLSETKRAGFALPEFVEFDWQRGLGRTELTQRKLGCLRPWAWGPDSVELFRPLFPNVTAEQRTADTSFNSAMAQLFGKAWSAGLLRDLLAETGEASWLCSEREAGLAAGSTDEALAAIAAIRARGHQRVVVKESLGLAGRNALRLIEPEIRDAHHRWLINSLRGGRQLVVEPWLDRVMDFSVQLEMTVAGLKLRGYTGLMCDPRGRFQGNWAESHHHRRIPAAVFELFPEPADLAVRMHRLYAKVFAMLERRLGEAGYRGPVGIDAFVYRDEQGRCRLKPIVEINPRYTMGRVLVELMRRVTPGSQGVLRLLGLKHGRKLGCDDLRALAEKLEGECPLQLEGEPVARIREGVVCLNDSHRAQTVLAVLQVGRELPLPPRLPHLDA